MSDDEQTAQPPALPEGFSPMLDDSLAKSREFLLKVGECAFLSGNWKVATKEQASRGWAGVVTAKLETTTAGEDADRLYAFMQTGARMMIYALDSLRYERARLAAAEAEVERLRAALADAEARGYARGVAAAVAHLRALASAPHSVEADAPLLSPSGAGLLRVVAEDLERGAHTTKEAT